MKPATSPCVAVANRRLCDRDTEHAVELQSKAESCIAGERIADLKAPGIAAAGLSVERTLREIARIAYGDPRRLFRADGTLASIMELDDDTAAMISAIEVDADGRLTRIPLWDKNAAHE